MAKPIHENEGSAYPTVLPRCRLVQACRPTVAAQVTKEQGIRHLPP